MIYTVTFNPSIDYYISLPSLQKGCMNRAEKTCLEVGGKGINVTKVLNNFGTKSVALGFIAGSVGEEIKRSLERESIAADWVTLSEGNSRINVKLLSEDETEINAKGPCVDDTAVSMMCDKVAQMSAQDVLVVSGSLATNMTTEDESRILNAFKGKYLIADMSGEALKCALSHKPFLVKPNLTELAQLVQRDLDEEDESSIIDAAAEIMRMGARNALVSCGALGAYLFTDDGKSRFCRAIKDETVNTVGAGDSLLAGFVSEFVKEGEWGKSLLFSVAAGCVAAFSEGLADNLERVRRAAMQMEVTNVSDWRYGCMRK